jgi:hypothetical protein
VPLTYARPETYAPDPVALASDLEDDDATYTIIERLLRRPPRRDRIGDVMATTVSAVARMNRDFAHRVVLDPHNDEVFDR